MKQVWITLTIPIVMDYRFASSLFLDSFSRINVRDILYSIDVKFIEGK